MILKAARHSKQQLLKSLTLGAAVMKNIMAEAVLIPNRILWCSLVINILNMVLPFVSMQLYDRIIPNFSKDTLFMLTMMMVGVFIFDIILKTARGYLVSLEAAQDSYHILMDAHARVLSAPADKINGVSQSTWVERFQSLNQVTDYLGSPSRLIAVDVPFSMVFIMMMTLVGGWLALIPIAVFIGFSIFAHDHGKKLRGVSEVRNTEDAKMRDFFIESLTGVTTIKGLGLEPQMQRRFERLTETISRNNYALYRLNDESQSFGNLIANVTQVMTVSIGAALVINEQISMGVLACCTLLSARAVQPLARLASVWNELQTLGLHHEKARNIRELPPVPADFYTAPFNRLQTRTAPATITLEHVEVRRSDGKLILEDVNLVIPAGGCIAISGADGSGKSAILKLIAGQATAESGRVLINGVPIDAVSAAGLKHNMSMITSNSQTFSGTILENIALFSEGENLEYARFAARLIGLEKDIEQLPAGYDTVLGENIAEQLPAGFLERILIARAIARKSSILLFDEANASLDMVNDTALNNGLKKLHGITTMVLVTNRPSMAKIADVHYRIENCKLLPMVHTAPAKISVQGGAA